MNKIMTAVQEYVDYVMIKEVTLADRLGQENRKMQHKITGYLANQKELLAQIHRLKEKNKELKEALEHSTTTEQPKYIPWEDVPVGHEFSCVNGGAVRLKTGEDSWFSYNSNIIYTGAFKDFIAGEVTKHWPRGEK